eukprot:COSAG01_NODE_2227_length_8132_cov_3.231420_12_plen_44_part_01
MRVASGGLGTLPWRGAGLGCGIPIFCDAIRGWVDPWGGAGLSTA